MSREIKFRMWNPMTTVMIDLHKVTLLALNLDVSGLYIPFIDGMPIMQFTGLLDKNSREIYEGDVLRWNNRIAKPEYLDSTWVVRWDEVESKFTLKHLTKSYTDTPFFKTHWKDNMEVIGNIYENPELLK
jgi:uncharacterized phage protein (TIGR01671 family)